MNSSTISTVPHWKYLVCPKTKQPLSFKDSVFTSSAGVSYPVIQGKKVSFLSLQENESFEKQRDFFDQVKAKAKDLFGSYYIFLVYLISPVMPRIHWSTRKTYYQHRVDQYTAKTELSIQIGSGNDRLNRNIVNLDIFAFPEVDIIADCSQLPYADNSVDVIVSLAVLEHVENPEALIKEAFRVLKPGGHILTGVPFTVGFHASPKDYYRWTHQGLQSLHERHGFTQTSIELLAGPTSGLIWSLQEWLAIVFSFNIKSLYFIELMLFYVLLSPLKLLDVLFIYHSEAYKIASSFLCIASKAHASNSLEK